MGLFDFLFMRSYEDRYIQCTETSDPSGVRIVIDTCEVDDSEGYPAETAISVDGGKVIVVQCYTSREEAELGHIAWVKMAEHGNIPNDIQDVGMSDIAKIIRDFSTPKLPDGNTIDMETE